MMEFAPSTELRYEIFPLLSSELKKAHLRRSINFPFDHQNYCVSGPCRNPYYNSISDWFNDFLRVKKDTFPLRQTRSGSQSAAETTGQRAQDTLRSQTDAFATASAPKDAAISVEMTDKALPLSLRSMNLWGHEGTTLWLNFRTKKKLSFLASIIHSHTSHPSAEYKVV